MDRKEKRKIIARIHLEKIVENVGTLKDIQESRKFVDFYRKKGYDAKKFEERLRYKRYLLLNAGLN